MFVFNTVELQDSTGSHDTKLVFWQFMSSHSFKQPRRIRLSESFATKWPSLPTTMFCISFERRNLISGHFCWPWKLLRAWFFYIFLFFAFWQIAVICWHEEIQEDILLLDGRPRHRNKKKYTVCFIIHPKVDSWSIHSW